MIERRSEAFGLTTTQAQLAVTAAIFRTYFDGPVDVKRSDES